MAAKLYGSSSTHLENVLFRNNVTFGNSILSKYNGNYEVLFGGGAPLRNVRVERTWIRALSVPTNRTVMSIQFGYSTNVDDHSEAFDNFIWGGRVRCKGVSQLEHGGNVFTELSRDFEIYDAPDAESWEQTPGPHERIEVLPNEFDDRRLLVRVITDPANNTAEVILPVAAGTEWSAWNVRNPGEVVASGIYDGSATLPLASDTVFPIGWGRRVPPTPGFAALVVELGEVTEPPPPDDEVEELKRRIAELEAQIGLMQDEAYAQRQEIETLKAKITAAREALD